MPWWQCKSTPGAYGLPMMNERSVSPSTVVPLSESSLRAVYGLDSSGISRQQLSSAASNSTHQSRIEYLMLSLVTLKR